MSIGGTELKMLLYYYILNENTFITHDGHIQLGIHNMCIQEFLKNTQVTYIETYWVPDVFSQRYKRVNYQKHLKSASIGTKDEN